MEFLSVACNLRDSFRILAERRDSGEIREYPGVSIASAGVTFQMFNAAFLSSPVASERELEHRILQALVHFEARNLPWAFWVCNGWLSEKVRRRARHIFQKHQLHFSVELPGMIAGDLNPPAVELPRVEIRRVTDESTREDFCAIGSLCFNVPIAWFREVFENGSVWDSFAGYVAYDQGTPVSTAATVVASDVAGVYNVATVPGQQRRGFGEAVVRHAVEKARAEHGIARTILQSTAQGFRLYKRMGYRTVTTVSVYSS